MSSTLPGGVQMPIVPSVFFPVKQPDEFANFVYDANPDVLNCTGTAEDNIVAATFATMPSGAGEIVSSLLSVTSNFITVWLASGVSGRSYIHKVSFTLVSGVILEVFIGQVCNPLLAVSPVPPAPTPGFGPTLNWP